MYGAYFCCFDSTTEGEYCKNVVLVAYGVINLQLIDFKKKKPKNKFLKNNVK